MRRIPAWVVVALAGTLHAACELRKAPLQKLTGYASRLL
jgi:hypothetical protein